MAASPLGTKVRPFSMSLTDDGASPTSPPISASVKPVDLRSEMRDAHVLTRSILRQPVVLSQRHPVTAVRETIGMPRPPNLPKFESPGPRIRWWREHRGYERKDFAKMVGMSYSGLADLENDRSKAGKKLHLIAAKLRLNAHYLETDKGEPEAEFAQELPQEPAKWPFESVQQSRLEKLNKIELSYAENKLQEALAEIEAERRRAKKAG